MIARALRARELGAVIATALGRSAVSFSAAWPRQVYPPVFNRYRAMSFGNYVSGAVRVHHPPSGRRIGTDISATLFLTAPSS